MNENSLGDVMGLKTYGRIKKGQWKVFLNYFKVNVIWFLVSSKASVRLIPPGFPFTIKC